MSKFRYDVEKYWYKYKGILLLKSAFPVDAVEASKKYQFLDGDVLCTSYPKTGQTWFLSLMHLIRHADKLENGEDVPEFAHIDWNFIESKSQFDDGRAAAERMAETNQPKTIKTHLPLEFFRERLDGNPAVKVVQVIRNPKDSLVSYYHFYKGNESFGDFEDTWDEFFEMFKARELGWGDLFTHTAEWYEYNKNRPNSLILEYENMKKDLKSNLVKLLGFLGRELPAGVVDTIVERATFKNMLKDPKLNTTNIKGLIKSDQIFLRSGIVGDYKNYFSEEQSQYVDQRIVEAGLEKVFKFE